MKLPSEFEEKMKRLLGDEFPSYIACYEEPRYYGLRVNTKKISVEDFRRICPFKIREVPWIENGFYFEAIFIGYVPIYIPFSINISPGLTKYNSANATPPNVNVAK